MKSIVFARVNQIVPLSSAKIDNKNILTLICHLKTLILFMLSSRVITFWHFQTSDMLDPFIIMRNLRIYLTFNGARRIKDTMAYQSD